MENTNAFKVEHSAQLLCETVDSYDQKSVPNNRYVWEKLKFLKILWIIISKKMKTNLEKEELWQLFDNFSPE